MLEIRKLLILSTAHLTPQTIAALSVTPAEKWPVSGDPVNFGFLLYAHDEIPEDAPADLKAVYAFAAAHNLAGEWIKFDSDVAETPGLPIYDHAAPGGGCAINAEIARLKGPDWKAAYAAWAGAQADAEGWNIFDSDERGAEIQRDDARAVFRGDGEALDFVRGKAAEGSAYHRTALLIHFGSRAAQAADELAALK